MKKLFIIIIIFISFHSLSKADDIRDFEIEGMSVGDSLLDYISVEKIENNIIPYFKDKRKYYIIRYVENLNLYDDLEIYLKSDDNNYIIKSISAGLYPDNLKECLKSKDDIVRNIDSSLNIEFKESNYNHYYYKNTVTYNSVAKVKGGYIRIECIYYDLKDKAKHDVNDNLSIVSKSNEIEKWFESNYE
jgi:hypothetical protein